MLPFTLPADGGYVVALSGGADSRLLLELTVRAVLSRGHDVGRWVCAAHMNHGIRGEEARRDENFCRAECQKLGVPLIVERADIPALARARGQSEETTAREVRYAFLMQVMKDRGFPYLLTAHNADDQLETLLFHLLRGSGTRGMIGIPADRSLGDTLADGTPLSVHRPLLTWSRRDILSGMDELGVNYVTDSTNLADGCTRNRLRHRIIPLLEDISAPGAPQSAAIRLGQAAREDEEALLSIAHAAYQAAQTPDGLPVTAIAAEAPAVAKRMIRLAYADCLGADPVPERTLSAGHLEDILILCCAGENGRVSNLLPEHMRAEIHAGFLRFAAIPSEVPAEKELRPLGPGVTVWDEQSPPVSVQVEAVNLPPPPMTDETVFASACFPAGLLSSLTARSRAPGDRMHTHGMTKNLKKLICDKHIPQSLRDRLPLICLSDGTPLWFPRVAFRDGFPAPTNGIATRVTVRIHISDPCEKP